MNDRLPGTSYDNPIWYRGYRIYVSWHGFAAYQFVHDDYDGADDANDNRHGDAISIAEAKAEIDLIEADDTAMTEALGSAGYGSAV